MEIHIYMQNNTLIHGVHESISPMLFQYNPPDSGKSEKYLWIWSEKKATYVLELYAGLF